jgi:hypothetical protein
MEVLSVVSSKLKTLFYKCFLGFKFGFVGVFAIGVLPLLGQGSKGDAVPLG